MANGSRKGVGQGQPMVQWVTAASNHAGAVAVAAACRRGCRNMPALPAIFPVDSRQRAMDETVRKIRHV